MVASEAADKRESEARAKAAAWAWYQRSGGSVTPTAGRSEAFATRCATRCCASRFQREAAFRHRASLASTASDSASALSSSSGFGNSSYLSHCTDSYGDATDPDESLNPDSEQISNPECSTDHGTCLDLVALHPTASWDCGSSLFDAFELVEMSKKLDAELHEPNLDVELLPQDLNTGSSLELGVYQKQHVLPLCDTPYNHISPPASPPPLLDSYDTFDTYDRVISGPDVQSKQAVYDMFCHYGDASKHVSRQTSKQVPAEGICGEEPAKQYKPRSGRMSLHSLAKALHQIRHPSSHSDNGVATAAAHNRHHHHHHHHAPYSPHQQRKALSMHANGAHSRASRLGEHYDDAIDKGRRKDRHIHHHHHHHYHYLFHSDDDYRLQSLDKSLMVAAAGLRSPKVNPVLSSYLESPARVEFGMDYGCKLAKFGGIPSPVGSDS